VVEFLYFLGRELFVSLRTLILNGCRFPRGDCFTNIYKIFRYLEHLDVSQCTGIFDVFDVSFDQSLLDLIDEWFIESAKNVPPLLSLNVGQCILLTDSGLLPVVRAAPTMKIIKIGGCPYVERINFLNLIEARKDFNVFLSLSRR